MASVQQKRSTGVLLRNSSAFPGHSHGRGLEINRIFIPESVGCSSDCCVSGQLSARVRVRVRVKIRGREG